MARILTGIQSSGRPHLGNILGAIRPALALAENPDNESFFFIADFHSLTSLSDGAARRRNVQEVAAAWLACGFDAERNYFYRQSDLPEVTELTWYLNCFTPYPMLTNAHSFKDKSTRLADVNAGLFGYPVLMAADILLYDADQVPVGKDQKQHLEMTRDIAGALNHKMGQDLLHLPEAVIREDLQLIPGTDGQKMSKSYGNTLDIFLPEKALKKQVMSILTDSTPLEEPKNPDSCHVFALYRLLAQEHQVETMRQNYRAGGYGYGHAKKELLGLLLDTFAEERKKYTELMQNPELIEDTLQKGADKVRPIAQAVLSRIREALGF